MKDQLNFSVIIPCFNEEKAIATCIETILEQTLLPNELVIVNDGSTDNTVKIVESYQQEYSFIKIVHTHKQPQFEPGTKIVQAFKTGLKTASNWEVVFKLDADLMLPSNYFQRVIETYVKNPKVGMAGGLVYIEKNGEWVFETVTSKHHLRGAIKSYRRGCYEAMNGVRESIGWDTIDVILAQFYGYELKILPDLQVRMSKPTGALYKKSHAKKMGLAMYKIDYKIFISIIAALKSSMNKKSIKDFFVIMRSYFKAIFDNTKKIVTKEEGSFIRQYRWEKMKEKLF